MAALQSAVGYRFENPENLLSALRHRSFVNQFRDPADPDRKIEDNQRLEFLGDAVLSLCVSTMLYSSFPDLKEGELSKMRAGLVNENQLAEIAREISMPECLFLGRGEEATGGRDKNSILADAVEALLAAIYLDRGFEAVMDVIESRWGGMVARATRDDFLKDFKTKLQEETQRSLGLTPEYRLTGSTGPDHARTFEVAVILGDKEAATGQGRSKKEAEQQAARNALDLLLADRPEST